MPHWEVHISGVQGGYACIKLPMRRGRTIKKAVLDAVALLNLSSPEELTPIDGIFGRFMTGE